MDNVLNARGCLPCVFVAQVETEMKTKLATIGTLVKIYPIMKNAPVISARVQDHLKVQFTYSRPDDDTVIGICRFDGGFEDDFETIDTRKPEQTAEESSGESGQEINRETCSWSNHTVGRRIPKKM